MSTALLASTAGIDAQNPWPGLSAFDEGSERFFNGRGAESADLLRLVSQAPLSVLFGKSGLGKTSLLQAGLFPRLRQQNVFPVYVRLDVRDRTAPIIEQAAAVLRAEVAKHGVDAPAPSPGESLWEHLHGRNVAWWSRRNQPLTPLFVFDQFEEVFTLGAENADGIDRLRLDLADLIENRIPAALAERIESGGSTDHLDLRGQRYKVLLSFREDFLPEVEGWKGELPSLMRNRLRLLPMSADRAVQVVTGKTPAGSTHELVGDDTAREIVRFVAAVQTRNEKSGLGRSIHKAAEPTWEKLEIEPALLSLVCEGLNEKRKGRGQATIDAALLKEAGAAIIGDFYRRCVAGVPERTRHFIEDALITEGGFRNSYPLQDALDQELLTELLLRQLVDRRLLRIDHQLGADRVELIHDRLTDVVREHRDRERERIRARRQRRMWWAAGSVAVVLVGVGALFLFLWLNAQKAERSARRAETNAQKAERSARRAEMETGHALMKVERQKIEAESERARAETEKDRADEQAARAKAETVVAEQATVQAKRALRDAVSGRLVVESRAILDGQRPATTDIALLLAAAAYRLNPSNDAYSVLHYALNATPGQEKAVVFPDPVIALSPDGKTAVTRESELRLWNAATGQPLGAPLKGHTGRVQTVAFSPDGKVLASGGLDKTVRLWNAATGQPRGAPLEGHSNQVWKVAFSPDGTTLVSASLDKTLRLWNVVAGLPRGVPLQGHSDGVQNVVFSPDGRTLVSDDLRTVRLWDAVTGQARGVPLQGLLGHSMTLASLAFSPDGTNLVVVRSDGTLQAWDTATGEPRGALLQQGPGGGVLRFRFSPDGKTLVSDNADQTLRLWDVATGRPRGELLRGHTSRIFSFAFSPDGRTVVSTSDDRTLILWDASTGLRRGAPLRGHASGRESVAFSSDGKLVSTGERTLRVWTAAIAQPRSVSLRGLESRLVAMELSPDGKTLATGGYDNTVRLWDAMTGQSRGEPLKGHAAEVLSLAFSPDGKTLVSGSGDNTLRLWDVATGAPRGVPLEGHKARILTVAFSPDGKTFASGGNDNILRLWDTARARLRGPPLQGHTSGVFAVAFSPDGKSLVSGSVDTTLRRWDVATGRPRGGPLQGHTDQLRSVAYSPDGTTIVSGGLDHKLRLWDAATGGSRGAPLEGHTDAVKSVAFSRDGKTVLSGSGAYDRSLRLWDATTGQPQGAPLRGHTAGDVLSVAFGADGTTLVSAGGDETVRRWDAPAVWIDQVCAKVVRNLSRAEWKQYAENIPYEKQCPGLPVSSD